ncbi:MAG: ParA family protein [Gammaproteobacteria bacterium]|jgi:cellulose biosynthesis protein BcsQ|nr:AAA family ATPase [Candidatus Thioaporhodococcus sediminis]TNF55350.1 MAG: ParA family protein [Gammaproteobacteria bacterium]
MKIIASYNIKGGVGKTATAVNLAYLSAREGNRTLIWDLDPQGAATYYFRVKPKIRGGTRALVSGHRDLDDLVKGTDFESLDLLPADFSYRNMDLVLEENKRPTKQLQKLLAPMGIAYDYVFLDCPPSISLVSENVFRASHVLLVPMIPTTLSARTLDQLQEFLEGHDGLGKVNLMPFFSMVDRRKHLHVHLMETLPESFPTFLKASIPYASDVERMGLNRMPLPAYTPPSNPVTRAYEALWTEIKEGLAKTGRW